MKLFLHTAAVTVVALTCVSVPAQADSLVDGDFTSWLYGATGTATVNTENAGGNPGHRLNITTVSGSLVYGTAILSSFSTTNPLEGVAYKLSFDVLAGPGSFGGGQAIQLLVEQQGVIYGKFLNTTGVHPTWSAFSQSGTFNSSSLNILVGSGPAHPDFTGITPTRFGFAAGNERSGTITQYYDNFRLDSPAITISAVPEPDTYALMLAGLGLVGFVARQGRKQI